MNNERKLQVMGGQVVGAAALPVDDAQHANDVGSSFAQRCAGIDE